MFLTVYIRWLGVDSKFEKYILNLRDLCFILSKNRHIFEPKKSHCKKLHQQRKYYLILTNDLFFTIIIGTNIWRIRFASWKFSSSKWWQNWRRRQWRYSCSPWKNSWSWKPKKFKLCWIKSDAFNIIGSKIQTWRIKS